MKQKIDYAVLTPSLTDWLCCKLRTAPPEASGAAELLESLRSLLEGTNRSLLLELDHSDDAYRPPDPVIRCGELEIDPRAHTVLRGGLPVSLTPKEFDILYFLARNRGEVFTKEQIYHAVWDDRYLLDDSNIMAFIRKLRKKIEPNPDDPIYILTIWGIGYKFVDVPEPDRID